MNAGYYRFLSAISYLALVSLVMLASTGIKSVKAEPMIALGENGSMYVFDSDDPQMVNPMPELTGLSEDESAVAFSIRSEDGAIYVLGDTSRLYLLDVNTGELTPLSDEPFSPSLDGERFAMDFNPVEDELRIVSDTGQNLSVSPDSGEVVENSEIQFASEDEAQGEQAAIAAIAFTNRFPGAFFTNLLAIDAGQRSLTYLPNPEDGTQVTVTELPESTGDAMALAVSSLSGLLYMALVPADDNDEANNDEENNESGVSELFNMILGFGFPAESLGRIALDTPVRALATPVCLEGDAQIILEEPAGDRVRVRRARREFSGLALAEPVPLAAVEYRVVNRAGRRAQRDFVRAEGTNEWTFMARRLMPGRNVVEVRAVDACGNESEVAQVVVRRRLQP